MLMGNRWAKAHSTVHLFPSPFIAHHLQSLSLWLLSDTCQQLTTRVEANARLMSILPGLMTAS